MAENNLNNYIINLPIIAFYSYYFSSHEIDISKNFLYKISLEKAFFLE